MISLSFIVEGQTEERFLQNALIPSLREKTNTNFQYEFFNLGGGIHISKLIHCINRKIYLHDYVATFIDLARLHNAKFNNYTLIMEQNISSAEKAALLEQQLRESFAATLQQKLIPHIQPYEFEALCFADTEGLAKTDPKIAKNLAKIRREAQDYLDSESINNHQLPGQRLAKYGYVKQSSTFAIHCDIEKIRASCPHFDQWLNKLESVLNK